MVFVFFHGPIKNWNGTSYNMNQASRQTKALKAAALIYLTLETLLQHVQAVSYMKYSPHKDGEEWTDEMKSTLSVLSYMALRISNEGYVSLFVFSAVLVTATLLLYVIYAEKVHFWNLQRKSKQRKFLIGFDHLFYGVGFIPLVSQFISTQYCNTDKNMNHLNELDCWDMNHMLMLETGLVFIGIILLIVGGILPVLKDERGGYELKQEFAVYFPVIYHVYLLGVVLILAPIRIPVVGICTTVGVILFLFVYNTYKHVHVAALKMGALFGFLWMFMCAEITSYHGETGSAFVWGWPVAVLVGYLVLPIKNACQHQEYKIIPLQTKISYIQS